MRVDTMAESDELGGLVGEVEFPMIGTCGALQWLCSDSDGVVL